MRSESTRAFGQPRETKPMRGAEEAGAEMSDMPLLSPLCRARAAGGRAGAALARGYFLGVAWKAPIICLACSCICSCICTYSFLLCSR